jgi:hypothetical protein
MGWLIERVSGVAVLVDYRVDYGGDGRASPWYLKKRPQPLARGVQRVVFEVDHFVDGPPTLLG